MIDQTTENIALEVVACAGLALLLAASIFVVIKTKQISHSRRFPVTFFGLSMLGYALLIIETVIYTFDPKKSEIYYYWIFYVFGRPLSFLPVLIISWRLKIIYTGYFDWRKFRNVGAQCVRGKIGERWMLIKMTELMIPCLIFYPLICIYGHKADYAYVILQVLYMLFFLYIIVLLHIHRKDLQRHHLDQSRIFGLFWLVVIVEIIFQNLAWYAYDHFSNRLATDSVSIGVLLLQSAIILALWHANYKIIRNRDQEMGHLSCNETLSVARVESANSTTPLVKNNSNTNESALMMTRASISNLHLVGPITSPCTCGAEKEAPDAQCKCNLD